MTLFDNLCIKRSLETRECSHLLKKINLKVFSLLYYICFPLYNLSGLTLSYLGGGALSARIFGDWLSLIDSFTYCTESFWFFLNEKKKMGQNLNSNVYLNPPRGVLEKRKFSKLIRMIDHIKSWLNPKYEPCISKIEWVL